MNLTLYESEFIPENEQKYIIFKILPAKLMRSILEMLNPNDVPTLRGVCRWFKLFVDSNHNFAASQILQIFIPRIVESFCEYGENDIYTKERSKKDYSISHSTKIQASFRNFHTTYNLVRSSLVFAHTQIYLRQHQFDSPSSTSEIYPNYSNEGDSAEETTPSDNVFKQNENLVFNSSAPTDQDPFQFVFDFKESKEQSPNGETKIFQKVNNACNLFPNIDLNEQREKEDVKIDFNFPLFPETQPNQQGIVQEPFKDNQMILEQFNSQQPKDPYFTTKANSLEKQAEYHAIVSTKFLWSNLQEPPLPILKLRRVDIGNFCNTWYQHKLVEVLWAGSKQQTNFSITSESPFLSLNQIIKSNRQFFISQVKDACSENTDLKNRLLNMRYYFYQHNSKLHPIHASQNQQKDPALFLFVSSLVDVIRLKCQVTYTYLKAHLNNSSYHSFSMNSSTFDSTGFNNNKKNGFDLISEYTINWNCYTAFLNELEETLGDAFEVFNESFDCVFPDHPKHPRMSIWRLMSKLWITEVIQQDSLKENLFGCFSKILSIRRQDNFLYQMNQIKLDNRVEQQYYMPEPLEHLSLTLLNNLTKTKNFSLLSYGEGYDYFHSFFSSNQYYEDSLLSAFVESILDLSLNEISVHYLGHSTIQVDQYYLELEMQMMDASTNFYKHQRNMFLSQPSHFLTFMQADLKYVTKIFKERSVEKLKVAAYNYWIDLFSDVLISIIPKLMQQFSEKDPQMQAIIISNSRKNLTGSISQDPNNIFTHFLTKILEKSEPDKTQIELSDKSNLLSNLLFFSSEAMKQDILSYIQICEEVENVQLDQDADIQELNSSRGLSATLNSDEQSFFFLSQNISDQILNEMIRKHKDNNAVEQIEEEPEKMEMSIEQEEQNQQQFIRGKASQFFQLELPTYNSDEESLEDSGKGLFGVDLFNKQQSCASEFSLGLSKEQSRLPNPINFFADVLGSNNERQSEDFEEQKGNSEELFKFNFGTAGEDNAKEQIKSEENVFSNLIEEEQHVSIQSQMMFTFDLESNDKIQPSPLLNRDDIITNRNHSTCLQSPEKDFFAINPAFTTSSTNVIEFFK